MNYEDALHSIVNGKAVLFCGAGFSVGVSSELGPLPTGATLAQELFLAATGREAVVDFDNLELSQVAEYFEQEKSRRALVDFLIKRFSVLNVPIIRLPSHVNHGDAYTRLTMMTA